MDKTTDLYNKVCDLLLDRLSDEDVSVEWVKEARGFLKDCKYEAPPVPGSKVQEVEDALAGAPNFDIPF